MYLDERAPAGRGAAAAGALALVKQEERSPLGLYECSRPARRLRWLTADGELAPVRCASPNKCRYCAMLTAFENALVVRLDALEGLGYPTWGLTTTTVKPGFQQAELRKAEEWLFRSLRRRHGKQVQYLGFVEFTTGKSATSGGIRRPHVHHLVKGLGRPDNERAAQLESEVSTLWRKYTGGAWRVECRPLRTPAGAIAYLALHHNKLEQQPPPGWSGKRFRPSRGYFSVPVPQLRAEAHELLRDQRIEAALVAAWDVPDGFDQVELDELLMDALPAARERAKFDAPKLVVVDKHENVLRHKKGASDRIYSATRPAAATA